MREVIRNLLLFVLGMIILISICVGMWGMSEIISSLAYADNEQATDWEAAVNALSTNVAEKSCSEAVETDLAEKIIGVGLSPEEVDAAIAGTLSVLEATALSIATPTPK